MDDQNLDDIVRDDVQIEMRQQLFKCFKKYGIEGSEQKIKELYQLVPRIQELFLIEYRRILKGESK